MAQPITSRRTESKVDPAQRPAFEAWIRTTSPVPWDGALKYVPYPRIMYDNQRVDDAWLGWCAGRTPPASEGRTPGNPYKVGEPEDEDGSSTVLDGSVALTADEIVERLNNLERQNIGLSHDLNVVARHRDEYRERAYKAEGGLQSAMGEHPTERMRHAVLAEITTPGFFDMTPQDQANVLCLAVIHAANIRLSVDRGNGG